ncbi:MAG: hypothetical protein ACYS9X_09910 [Planctomycetota bacterium]|jgi:hypothetical protein
MQQFIWYLMPGAVLLLPLFVRTVLMDELEPGQAAALLAGAAPVAGYVVHQIARSIMEWLHRPRLIPQHLHHEAGRKKRDRDAWAHLELWLSEKYTGTHALDMTERDGRFIFASAAVALAAALALGIYGTWFWRLAAPAWFRLTLAGELTVAALSALRVFLVTRRLRCRLDQMWTNHPWPDTPKAATKEAE